MSTGNFDKKWNWWLWILQAITFLSIATWISLSKGCLLDYLNIILSNQFVSAALGAFSGGAALLFVGYIQNSKRQLSKLNTAQIVCKLYIDNFIYKKIKHFDLAKEAYQKDADLLRIIVAQNCNAQFEMSGEYTLEDKLDENYPRLNIEDIADWVTLDDKVLICAFKINECYSALIASLERKNEFIRELKTLNRKTACYKALGLPINGETDSTMLDCIKNIEGASDALLWYADTLTDKLNTIATKICPFWLRHKILKVPALSTEHRMLIPTNPYPL